VEAVVAISPFPISKDAATENLETTSYVIEAAPVHRVDPQSGLSVFRFGRPVTLDDVKALEDDDALSS